MSWLDTIISWDRALFLELNGLHSPFFDFIMYWLSNRIIWVPMYLFLIFLLIREYRRKTLYILVSVAILIVLTDQVSVYLFKEVFLRLRPCHDPLLQGMVYTLNGECGGTYGFISSHATNTFGLVIFLFPFMRKFNKGLAWILIAWAALASYSRIYLGTHFPLDVLAGAMVGILLGIALRRFAQSMLQNFP